jgi:predicted DNA-binding WGR domain protein
METRYFEFIGADERRGTDASKFWEVSTEGTVMTVRFGKIDANGQTKQTIFDDSEAANMEAEKLIAAKLRKGYVEKNV